MESICFAFKHHIDVLKENNIKINKIYASDGGSKSNVWMQMMSDIIQMNISIVDGHYGSSQGAAFLAAKSMGLYQSYDEVNLLSKKNNLIKFQKKNLHYYKKKYYIFRKLYKSLYNIYPEFNGLLE